MINISIHAPHTGRDDLDFYAVLDVHNISIHAPHTGRDSHSVKRLQAMDGFQSTRPIRGATVTGKMGGTSYAFQSTRPIRGATQQPERREHHPTHFNPRAPYGARLACFLAADDVSRISIHAPHTGRDQPDKESRNEYTHFNPRAPYGARQAVSSETVVQREISIHAPHTGRDDCGAWWGPRARDFNPRAPYGARRNGDLGNAILHNISIHAPHTGRDARHPGECGGCFAFQSTRPIRGATGKAPERDMQWPNFNPRAPYGARHDLSSLFNKPIEISIHAPHTGRDKYSSHDLTVTPDFNPRAPYGARRAAYRVICVGNCAISIHAPHTGRDVQDLTFVRGSYAFQSTRPIRGATLISPSMVKATPISIHAPHTGRDGVPSSLTSLSCNFNPRAPYGARLRVGSYVY